MKWNDDAEMELGHLGLAEHQNVPFVGMGEQARIVDLADE